MGRQRSGPEAVTFPAPALDVNNPNPRHPAASAMFQAPTRPPTRPAILILVFTLVAPPPNLPPALINRLTNSFRPH